jgi:disulfide bond formation protein DsbB
MARSLTVRSKYVHHSYGFYGSSFGVDRLRAGPVLVLAPGQLTALYHHQLATLRRNQPPGQGQLIPKLNQEPPDAAKAKEWHPIPISMPPFCVLERTASHLLHAQ